MSHAASYSSAPCEDDDMFEVDCADVVHDDESTMFADDDKPVQKTLRPSELKTSVSVTVSQTNGQDNVSTTNSSKKSTKSAAVTSPSSPLDSLRSWSSSALVYARHYVSEHIARRGNAVSCGDKETMARVTSLREQQRHYAQLLRTATTLTSQLEQIVRTQRALGSAFGELSQGGGDVALGEQFACTTDVMRLMSKQGENLLASLAVFRQSMSTLCNTTIEDTLSTVKKCDAVRIKYDAYRSRVEGLRIAQSMSNDSALFARLRESETTLHLHKQKYDRIHSDLVIKLKFLEENKTIVCQKHLYLLHKAFTAYVSGNLHGVDDILRRCQFTEPTFNSSCERAATKVSVTAK